MGVCLTGKEKAIAAALRGTQLLAAWPSTALRVLSAEASIWRFQKGETVAERGDPATGFWAVAAGSVTNCREPKDGRYYLQGVAWPGDVFALTGAIDGEEVALTHVARTDTLAVFVPRAAFLAGVLQSEERTIGLFKFLGARTRVEYEGQYTTVMESVRCRIAKTLAFLTRRALLLPKDSPSPIDITQNELADMLGISRQTLNRNVVELMRAGIVARDGNTIRVIDFKGLLAVMEESDPVHPIWRDEMLSWDRKLSERR